MIFLFQIYIIDMALKILRREMVDRELTYEDVRDQKAMEPFKTNRQTSKTLNFLLIYGGSASILATNCLELNWTKEQLYDYIRDENLEDELKLKKKLQPHEDKDKLARLVAATRLRDNYFKGYPGLLTRGDDEIEFANDNGYVRCYFGGTRKLIEIKKGYRGLYDNKKRSREMRNLENICRNTAIQNLESCIVKDTMCKFQSWCEDTGKKSFLMNEVHDSMDTVTEKTELHDTLAHMKHLAERAWPETKNGLIPLKIDVEIADLSQGDCYKSGRAPEEFGITWEGLEYEDPNPFNIERTEEFDKDYFKRRKAFWEKKNTGDPLKKEIENYLNKYNK